MRAGYFVGVYIELSYSLVSRAFFETRLSSYPHSPKLLSTLAQALIPKSSFVGVELRKDRS